MLTNSGNNIVHFFKKQTTIAPLVILRIIFGAVMFFSLARFYLNGWIDSFYITPKYFFPFYGFEWLSPLPAYGMYLVFAVMALSTLLILLGLFYRIATLSFFFSFLYVELLDKTYYLNHYYFISIISFLLILVPAHRYFSLDVWRKPSLLATHVPNWTVYLFKLQLCILYFFAGLAKVNPDWLLEARPLIIWLPAKLNTPLIGGLLKYPWVAFAFSWAGMLYDLLIWIFLLYKPTRVAAYVVVIIFHFLTGLIFPHIGMFPYIMMLITLVFMPDNFHLYLIRKLSALFSIKQETTITQWEPQPGYKKLLYPLLILHFFLQITVPMRYLCYPGPLFWTEEGFRFSWRVMLMEKAGTAFFYVTDPSTGKKTEVNTADFITPLQEKMIATQPDMILQYAHLIDAEYQKKGIKNPKVTAEVYVTVNGHGSRKFINDTIDLSKEKESFRHKTWIMPSE